MFMPAVCVLFFIKLHIKKVVTLFLKGKGLFGQDIRCLHNKDFQELYILHAILVESTLKTIFWLNGYLRWNGKGRDFTFYITFKRGDFWSLAGDGDWVN